jgi:cytochrome c
MRGLNNEIMDALALSNKVPQQFQEFVAFLQWLNNQIRAQEAEMKGKPVP